MKKILRNIGIVLAFVLLVILVRTLTSTSKQIEAKPVRLLQVNEGRIVKNLQRALQIQTISFQDRSKMSGDRFAEFHALLEDAFPNLHGVLKKETVAQYSLLYTWRGSDPSLAPILLTAHQDVVPIESPDAWDHGPFSGALADGYIYGRGALDDKGSLLGIFEAVEALLAEGFQPRRTVLVASGHDEEVGGWEGAAKIAELLESRGIEPEFSLDEGMAVIEGVVPGISQPVALIGLTEKGYLTLELSTEAPGGHSSQPPAQTALGILSKAVVRLEENKFPAALQGPMRQTFDYLGPEMAFPIRLVFANLWLFGGLVEHQLKAQRTTDAALRTTTAVTIMEGGTKENVLPTHARVIVNFRLALGDTIDGAIERVRDTVDDDRITIRVLNQPNEAPPPSEVDGPSYRLINQTILEVFPGVIVAPSMMLGGSDSHHYAGIAKNCYRFGPLWLTEDDIDRIHGPNERISTRDYVRAVQFFAQIIRNAA